MTGKLFKAALLSATLLATSSGAFADGLVVPQTMGLVLNGASTAGIVVNDALGNVASLNLSPYAPDFFGTGADGSVTCTAATILTRDMVYANLTVQSGCAITTNNFRIFVSGTLDLSAAPSGAIAMNGVVGTAGGAGGGAGGGVVASPTVSTTTGVVSSVAGGAGTTTVGGNAANSVQSTIVDGGSGNPGGLGGAGASGASGAVGSAQSELYPQSHPFPTISFVAQTTGGTSSGEVPSASGGAGAAGGGDGTNKGGGGAGAPTGGGRVFIAARFIARGTNTATDIIQAEGGAGGAGGSPGAGNAGGGGGSGGAGGGHVYIVTQSATGTTIANAINVTGGNGGPGGVGVGTGLGGSGAYGGRGGWVEKLNLGSGTYITNTDNYSVGPTPPVAPSGTTAGTGGIAPVSRAAL